jgi:hypothetical protein
VHVTHLLSFTQGPPLPPPAPESHLARLKALFLDPDLDAILGDVAYCGKGKHGMIR